MSDLEQRVDRLELDSLKRRVDGLDERVGALQPKRGLLAGLKEFAPFLTPVAVALIGVYATVVIKGAIEEQRLELSQLTAIRELMVDLAAPGTDLAAAEATAVTLSAFGPPAIVPLIHELQADGQTRPLAAEEGLRTLAFQHADRVCATLVQVLEDRSRLFAWKTHRRVIELLGQIGCADAAPVLRRYRTMFEADDAVEVYRKRVNEVPEPDMRAIGKLKESVKAALERLES